MLIKREKINKNGPLNSAICFELIGKKRFCKLLNRSYIPIIMIRDAGSTLTSLE
jgi:hypothetical protein